ncbi:MAG: cyanophycin synthetase, partial [Tepidanaerobacteraceae bacterium]
AEVIDDAYNASPDSMKAALDYLEQRGRDKKKAAILGDMLELGNIASSAHFEIGKYAAKKADMIVAIGSFSEDIKKGALEGKIDVNCVHAFKALEQASAEIIGLVEDCDIVLVKASRGMKLEQITELLVRGS